MRPILTLTTFAFALALGTLSFGQQGGNARLNSDDSVRNLQRALSTYLNGEEVMNILSPGEFSEWKLKLKAGQVILAEARSDAFDPALQIVDSAGKVLAENDDRYPGDQRPLLFWTCPSDGDYAIHARCFHDKSGGQFFLRYKTYDSVDLTANPMAEKEVDTRTPFILRFTMKKGEMKSFVSDSGGPHNYLPFHTWAVIADGGLPDIDLARPITPVTGGFMAPVAGNYYAFANVDGNQPARGVVHAGWKEVEAQPLAKVGDTYSAKATTNTPTLWELPVKAGQLIECTMSGVDPTQGFVVAEVPDISTFELDPKKPELNPFYPQPKDKMPPDKGPAFDILYSRARDSRVLAFRARRDTHVWLATNAYGRPNSQYTVNIKPANVDLVVDKPNPGKLTIGTYDYWTFDAQAGDVMTLDSTAPGFVEQVIVDDPDFNEIRRFVAGPDQSSDKWQMIVQKPGRYIVTISCMGDGGGGAYSLTRQVLHAKSFAKGTPAVGSIGDGQIQIWKFTATPKEPLLIQWKTDGPYDIAIYDDKGQRTDFERQAIDAHNMFGILKVDQPRTYVIVLTGKPGNGTYSIELNDLPGFKHP